MAKPNKAAYRAAYQKLKKTHKPFFVFLPKSAYVAVKAIAKKRGVSLAKLLRGWIKAAAK